MDLEELKMRIEELRGSPIKDEVEGRLQEFRDFASKGKDEWFSELCFCLLTSNSKARTAMEIQERLGADGFRNADEEDVRQCIIDCKHRFHNNKTRFIMEARSQGDIKSTMESIVVDSGQEAAREWLVKNIKGLGMKEASHFLRNVGYHDLAILDRHILRLMHENGLLDEMPKSLTPKRYVEIERTFKGIADDMGMSAAELDVYMWYLKTGAVLK